MKKILLVISSLYFVCCNNTETSKTKQDSIEDKINTKTEILTEDIEEKVNTNFDTDTQTNKEVLEVSTEKKEIEEIIDSKEDVSTTVKEKATKEKDEKQPKLKDVDNTFINTKETVVQENIEEIKEPAVLKANHDAWDKLTKTYVSNDGKVNYKAFKSKTTSIESYLLHLQNTPPTKKWSRNEKLAYWFNLYNASTVHLVASNYPVKSIKDINDGKPWDRKFIKSGTNLYSLNDIENTIVRPNYNEPRLHVAFNCAAISCPNLLNGAFSPTNLNNQLNSLSKKWINDVFKNEISVDKLEISEIFNWYKVDFKEGVIPFINKYSTVKANSNTNITYKEYNWNLNE